MKKALVVVGLVVLVFVACGFCAEVTWQDIGRGNLELRTVLVHPLNPQIIYIGSSSGVFKSEDRGASWRNILSARGQNRAVNFLVFDPYSKNSIYAAGGNGLYCSLNQGRDWKRIFKGKNAFENECTTLAVLANALYLGTKEALFVSKDKGRSWTKVQGRLGRSHILAIACNTKEPNYIYVACVDGVFKTKDDGQTWERIFVVSPTENGNGTEEETEDQDEEEQFSNIRYISIDPVNSNFLYLATSQGIFKSQDRGTSWQMLSDYGLLSKDTKFLLLSVAGDFYTVAKSGIFKFKDDRWHELSFNLEAGKIYFLAQDNEGSLYAACEKGLFKASSEKFHNENQDNITAIYDKNEPTINEVQAAAIKYAEVEPEKIARWRKQAVKRALLPKLSVGMDRDKNRTTSKSIWGTYSSYSNGNITAPDRYCIGPDDKTLYDNTNWNVSLSWELGDLIWSDDQTNIDVRSRLMVQLRDDILDEVTKLYFERLRVKMELDNLSIEDRKKRAEKDLRIQELTASIDALTGGYFSREINKVKN